MTLFLARIAAAVLIAILFAAAVAGLIALGFATSPWASIAVVALVAMAPLTFAVVQAYRAESKVA